VTIKVEGLDKLMARLRVDPLVGKPLRDGFEAVGHLVVSEARKRAPVDRGLLRASIAHEAETLGVKVGAKPKYAPYMEYGTGLVHDHPSWPRKRHVVPPGALAGWGKRKGADGAAVANAISRRGGLKPRRYLRGALEDNTGRIVRIVAGALKRIEV
jgi:hypothetical protein